MILAAAAAVLLLPVLVIGAATGGLQVSNPSPAATATIPPEYLALYEQAGIAFGIPWELLAGIGTVECDNGQSTDPACWQEGAVNSAGAGGPMQFLASTWAEYGISPIGDNPPDRWNPADAIFSAANYLRASGAPQNIPAAVYAYCAAPSVMPISGEEPGWLLGFGAGEVGITRGFWGQR